MLFYFYGSLIQMVSGVICDEGQDNVRIILVFIVWKGSFRVLPLFRSAEISSNFFRWSLYQKISRTSSLDTLSYRGNHIEIK